MKSFIPVALLIASGVSASAVSAQDPAVMAPPAAAPTAPAPAAPAVAEYAARPAAGAKTESVVLKKTRFETVRTSPVEAPARRAMPNNWWWTVGAIVLAGVILALVL